jgi:ACS family sodium-dependent inorganic phosphate cotransporter
MASRDVASTIHQSLFTGYFLTTTGGNWAYSLFFPIAILQVISTLVFQIWKSDPVDFDAIQAGGVLRTSTRPTLI